MSDEQNQPRIRNAMENKRFSSNGESPTLEFYYDEEKLREENKYRMDGEAYPQKLEVFNWGACLLPVLWGPFNSTPITILIIPINFIPYIGIIFSIIFNIYCGMKGNEWAWKNKTWKSLEDFHRVQKKWAIAGIICSILSSVVTVLFIAGVLGSFSTK